MATLWSRDAVAERILAGETLIIFRHHLLRIPASWLDAHPGGNLALLHFVGRDATDEIEAYHSDETLKLVPRYSIGRVELSETGWEPLIPPVMSGWVRKPLPSGQLDWHREAVAIRSAVDTKTSPSSQILLARIDSTETHQPAPTLETLLPPPTVLSPQTQAQHSRAYKELHVRIVDAGLYKTRYLSGYGPEIFRYTLLGCLSAFAYSYNWLMTSAVLLGLMWHQLVFTAHDLGHMGVTHNWAIDRILGILIADWIGGLSIGWWVEVCALSRYLANLSKLCLTESQCSS